MTDALASARARLAEYVLTCLKTANIPHEPGAAEFDVYWFDRRVADVISAARIHDERAPF